MQLWNEYEGRTIAEAYPLEKLLSPEGRSAFFSTSNGTGTPAVIRLIESHFDEAEILERWRQVTEIKEPHLITLRRCGQTELDGTSLVYAVMEPSDDNLAEILKQRPLTPQETREIATSLVPALAALHAHNLVHEHVEAANVLATGTVVKLRSDCIREAPEGEEGAAVRARDVHDLAVVLLQALTLRDTLPGTPLPAPFDAVIRNGISGAWGLAEISAALPPPAPIAPLARPVTPAPTTAAAAQPAQASASRPSPEPPVAPKLAPRVTDRLIKPVETMPSRPRGLWIAGGVAALLVLILVWRHFNATPVAAPVTLAPETTATAPAPAPSPAPKPSASVPAAGPVSAAPAASSAAQRSQWRVVAYTFNHQEQAQKRAAELATKYGSLHPEVFTPTGKAPYLVTLGGPMDRNQATAVRNQARSAGLPRDTYTQNYSR
ncbi:SPOR domain-containing protein [Granulicella sp. dw_53]|uniref:SPOR domain-containing protein n=1 Tax=Granulicella sp. dw_53 TaxID=2719792 RepID=UPI001BD5BE50|nr:SPOR domain-containing protein [Granulicella sp. dw_53]